MSKKTNIYVPIPSNTKKEIRLRYELGEPLKHLCFEYKVNYRTMKNYSSSEGWVKGSKKGLYTVLNFLHETEEDIKNREQSDKYLKFTTLHLQAHLFDLSKNKQEPKNKNQEEALFNRIKSAVELDKLSKSVFKKRDNLEELEFRKAFMEYEKLVEDFEDESEKDKDIHVG